MDAKDQAHFDRWEVELMEAQFVPQEGEGAGAYQLSPNPTPAPTVHLGFISTMQQRLRQIALSTLIIGGVVGSMGAFQWFYNAGVRGRFFP